MERLARTFLTIILALTPVTVSAVPQIAVSNNRTYRYLGGNELEYRGGELLFFLFDGNAFSAVECPFLPAGPGLLPYFPGALPCPAGHNAFITTRFGDRDRDVSNLWGRLGAVTEATRIPSRLPELMELVAAPVTSLPRPSREFSDRSTLVLHDLQSATFREKEATRYEMKREYFVRDVDANSDGVVTDAERRFVSLRAEAEEVRHLRETIITSGTSNGYLFTYPILPWIQANRDLNPELAPRDQIAVNQLKFVEAFPGASNRAGITNTSEGFVFNNLPSVGTDYDGDPAILVDFRLPGSVSWQGNDFSNLIGSLDSLYLKVFERRFTPEGTPIVYQGPGPQPLLGIALGETPTDPVVATIESRLGLNPPNHGFESGEEIFIYETGFSAIDGRRLFASRESTQTGFDGNVNLELMLDDGLTVPLTFDFFPDGTQGVINPLAAGIADIPDIVLSAGSPVSVSTLDPHGLADGDEITLDGTGLTAFEGRTFFVGESTANQFELYEDGALTVPYEVEAFPNIDAFTGSFVPGEGSTAIIVGTEENDFEHLIWPFPFVDDIFGGQLLLPSVFDRGYDFPDVTFRLFFGLGIGAQNLGIIPDPPRNDLILRIRFARTVAAEELTFTRALLPGDLSRRDFEIELCLVDTIEGASKAFEESLAGKSVKSKGGAKNVGNASDSFNVDADYDGDGQSNLYEFAFDTSGSTTELLPSFADENTQIQAQVSVTIDPETSRCELTIGKRPGVREYLEYYFEEVGADGIGVEIDPSDPDNTAWELVTDDNLTYKLVSTGPVSGSSFFRACVRKNTFGIEITE